MALVFIEGFDHVGVTTITGKWIVSGIDSSQISSSYGRFEGKGLNITTNLQLIGKDFSTTYASGVIGFALKMNSFGNITKVAQLLDSSSNQLQLHIDTDHKIYLKRNGTTLASADYPNDSNWHYIEWKFKITNSTSTGENVVRVDETTLINLSSGDTQETGNAYINRFYFFSTGSAEGVNVYIDDIYFLDLTGTANNDFLGEVRVQTLYPDGNGNSSQWVGQDSDSTNNYQNVDETGAPDDDTTYNESGTVGDRDLYTFQDVSNATTIFGVQVVTYAKKTDAGTRKIDHTIRAGGTNYDSSAISLASSYNNLMTIYDKNPNGSVAWTLTSLNAAEFGVRMDT
jgi:hypothetical protein